MISQKAVLMRNIGVPLSTKVAVTRHYLPIRWVHYSWERMSEFLYAPSELAENIFKFKRALKLSLALKLPLTPANGRKDSITFD